MKLVSVVLLLAVPALAQGPVGSPVDVVKYRQSVMKALNGHLRALGPLASKKVSIAGHAELHARSVAELARAIAELFPAGTGPQAADTEAKEEVWTDAKKFAAAMAEMREKADALQKAAAGDASGLKGALEAAADACSACHKAFRKKE
jgi:cytochrome c556